MRFLGNSWEALGNRVLKRVLSGESLHLKEPLWRNKPNPTQASLGPRGPKLRLPTCLSACSSPGGNSNALSTSRDNQTPPRRLILLNQQASPYQVNDKLQKLLVSIRFPSVAM